MFEIFTDQNNETLTQEIGNKRAKGEKKRQKYKNKAKTTPQNLKRKEETVLSMLQSLSDEEINLLTEKNQLLDMEKNLKERIIDEIEEKKSNINNLQTEIPKIKKRVEFLAKMLKIPVIK